MEIQDWERPTRRQVHPNNTSFFTLLLAILAGVIGATSIYYWLNRNPAATFADANDPKDQLREADPKPTLDDDEKEAVNIFKEAKESIVNVDQVYTRRRPDMKLEVQQAGTGSGFVWDDEGRIVTNYHVIRDAAMGRLGVRIVLADHSAWECRVIGVAPNYDLAVVQVDQEARSRIKKLKVGSSKDLLVGQRVYAIGNPFGYSLTLTKGIISALDREIDSPAGTIIPGAIQTQAPINPGNSGGPLLDKAGRMIGVNTQIASPSGGNVGIGFAIPADTVNAVVTELIRNGKIAKPDMGIQVVDQWKLRRWGIDHGVMIAEIVPGGPAEDAGLIGLRQERGNLLAGDLIIKFAGTEIRGLPDFLQAIGRTKPGDKVKVTFERGDEVMETEVKIRGI
ncbi:MAG: trypsin-like peptidase domain-containing protein [Gemmataceae bacterium]